jgi:hypothetical protein
LLHCGTKSIEDEDKIGQVFEKIDWQEY